MTDYVDFNAVLSSLNPEQKNAVETTEGPVLVLSGAGTGKTTVLTARIAYIIKTQKALPFQCLAVTFTNKAAREMQERLESFIGDDAKNVWLGTFHRISLKILRRHASKVGLEPDFTVLDASDQERLLKQIMTEKGLDLKENPPSFIMNQIQRLKDQGLTPDKACAAAVPASRLACHLYETYQERLKTMNAADFGDLLLYCLELFLNDPVLLDAFRKQFRYIMVDEYQDTNVAQYLWLRLLADGHKNLCCVGDDDQSIYSWRGAEVGNILKFETDFPQAKVIRLESNYRSTSHILAGASALIAHNEHRLDKTLRVAPGRDGNGEKIHLLGVWNGADEAVKICDAVERENRHGTELKDIAVLVRASFQTRAIEEQLLNYGLPYKIIAGMRFYEREEIKDAVAYARFLVQPKDDMAFLRIVNKPKRGVGDAALQKIRAFGFEHKLCFAEAAETMLNGGLIKGAAKNGLTSLFELMETTRPRLEDEKAADILSAVLEDSGYIKMWENDKSPDAAGKIENIKELIGDIKSRFDSFDEFLEYVSLVTDNDMTAGETGNYVSVMTLHAAKGLEFDTVFLPGWEEEIFPHRRALDEGGIKALEEERRLAYVGITRARKKVFISYAGSRVVFGQYQSCFPSRFISELPREHIESENQQNFYSFGEERRTFARSYDDEDFEPEDSYDRFFRREKYSSSRFRDDEYGDGYSAGYRNNKDKSYTNADYSYKNNNRSRRTGGFFSTTKKQPAFAVGADVYHQSFGHGKVIEANGNNVSVLFDEAGLKKVMADYLESA